MYLWLKLRYFSQGLRSTYLIFHFALPGSTARFHCCTAMSHYFGTTILVQRSCHPFLQLNTRGAEISAFIHATAEEVTVTCEQVAAEKIRARQKKCKRGKTTQKTQTRQKEKTTQIFCFVKGRGLNWLSKYQFLKCSIGGSQAAVVQFGCLVAQMGKISGN